MRRRERRVQPQELWRGHHGAAAREPPGVQALTPAQIASRSASAEARAAIFFRNARLPPGEARRSEPPELPRGDAVLLHLEVQGLVVGAEEPRRLAPLPTGDLKDPADRLLLGVRRR